ncbi:ATP-dependent metallopeptidase FtsH/Yme1/Tma family protein [Proteiniborus sp. MB09-C3]|uniref:ATP-dependent metallopeptidase FtsH/Yme1/Tma family protein n=1 Tax=Proteiniborus sp. MB09-C3 TaxID=3050072 RepID=UPI002553E55E|nr:ATP-dependent metallopeptidase FtsH/Yme1/Tma family protein [Proteiniborus sp. MB09-C3]WIV10456.1 ATP-dependent metallopeptidase FtsH/Yme1/Tma family protein [Proteiniborus sp. MB09-C3]
MKLLKNKRNLIILFAILSIVIVSAFVFLSSKQELTEISYIEFNKNLENGNIQSVNLTNKEEITGVFKDGKLFRTDNPRTEGFKEKLLNSGVDVKETDGNSTIGDILTMIVVLSAFSGLFYLVSRNSNKLAEKEMTKMSDIDGDGENSSTITFDDVAGNDEVKESLKEMVDFIREPEKYERYGARMPRGVLLYGPPGTGKTLLAKALAGEARVPFFAVTGSDFIQVYAGLGASRIRSLFKKARAAGKCVIFIDEIDALGKKRKGGASNGSSDESDRTLNALLTEMSGFKENQGIIVVAATNRVDTLDEALLRPGRFDRQLEVGLPDINARYKILELHSKNKPISKQVDLRKVAYQTVYFSGAKLESLMNESAMLAARYNDNSINMVHIDKAFYTVIAGEEKKDRSYISIEEKKVTAYHEAGHALVTKLTSPLNRVTKISIIPSTKGAGGFSMNIPPDKLYQSKEDILNHIMVALAGRASEEIIFGKDKITTGALNDLQKATDMLVSMIARYGMDDNTGLLNFEVLLGDNIGSSAYVVDRAKKLIEELYSKTLNLIKENISKLENISERLLINETMDEDELNTIINSAA